jgi:hypothetical protein
MGLPAAYRKARTPAPWSRYCGASVAPDMRFRCPRWCTRSRAGETTRGPATQLRRGPDIPAGLCVRGSPTSSGAAIPLGREPRNGTEWTMMPPSLRGANTGFLTRRRVNGGADGPWASRAERSPAREAHWPAPRRERTTLTAHDSAAGWVRGTTNALTRTAVRGGKR